MRCLIPCWAVVLAAVMALPASGQTPDKRQAPDREEPNWVPNNEAGAKNLVKYLKSHNEQIVWVGLDGLARMGLKRMGSEAKPAISAILGTLKHEDWWLRIEAARTLIDLNVETEAAHGALSDALRAKDPVVRLSLAKTLGEIVNPPFDWSGLFSCWGPGPRPQRAARPEFTKPAVAFLMAAMKDTEARVRLCAATSLGRIGAGAKEAVPALLNALEDKDPMVREAAAEAARDIVIDAAAKVGVKSFTQERSKKLLDEERLFKSLSR